MQLNHESKATKPSPSPKTALIVWPDNEYLEVMHTLFNIKGYSPITSSSCIEAVEIARQKSPIIDLSLIPSCSLRDYDLDDLVRDLSVLSKVIIHGGYCKKEHLPIYFDLGASAFIQTPQSTNRLFEIFESVLNGESGIAIEGPQGWS